MRARPDTNPAETPRTRELPRQRGRHRRGRRRRARHLQRRRLSALGVTSAAAALASAVILAGLCWTLLVEDTIIGQQQVAAATTVNASASPVPIESWDPATPRVPDAPDDLVDFATLYIPRFGEDYVRVIRQGIDVDNVLNQGRVGHYPDTAMPGAVGNFAIAGHRSAYGGAMHLIDQLQAGDPIYVRTADGWYTYIYQSQQIVDPADVATIAPVPNDPVAQPTQRYLTLTTCDPLYSTAHRIAAWALLEQWQPLAEGAPAGVPSAALAATAG